MSDGWHEALEENLAVTRRVVDACGPSRLSGEAELGKVGGKEDDLEGGDGNPFTDPQQAKEFVERTGVNSLAVAIGTAHGLYKGTPKLEFDLLRAIREVVSIPLVLHGASGVPDDAVRQAIELGICKVNFATELRIAYSDGVKSYLQKDPDVFDPKKYSKVGIANVVETVKAKIAVCGSAGQA